MQREVVEAGFDMRWNILRHNEPNSVTPVSGNVQRFPARRLCLPAGPPAEPRTAATVLAQARCFSGVREAHGTGNRIVIGRRIYYATAAGNQRTEQSGGHGPAVGLRQVLRRHRNTCRRGVQPFCFPQVVQEGAFVPPRTILQVAADSRKLSEIVENVPDGIPILVVQDPLVPKHKLLLKPAKQTIHEAPKPYLIHRIEVLHPGRAMEEEFSKFAAFGYTERDVSNSYRQLAARVEAGLLGARPNLSRQV